MKGGAKLLVALGAVAVTDIGDIGFDVSKNGGKCQSRIVCFLRCGDLMDTCGIGLCDERIDLCKAWLIGSAS